MISLGPVFQAECLTTARRKRYYFLRFAYGTVLLSIVGVTYQQQLESWTTTTPGSEISLLAAMANAIFTSFISAQIVAVLCLTPAMVAGTIADEKQRKTLHYLLASQLSSLEIVGGKLAARLLQLVVLVLVGLPIMSILSLFGGLDPQLVLVAFLGTFTTAFAVAGLAIFVSTLANRARDAIVIVYGVLVALLCLPTILPGLLGKPAPGLASAVAWLTDPITRLDPFQLIRLTDPQPGLTGQLVLMALGHLVLGSIFVALGVVCLRPAFGRGGRVASSGHSGPRRRWLWGRPEVGVNPLLWKELHVTAPAAFLRYSGLLIGVFALIFLGDAMLDYTRNAWEELSRFGYGDGGLGNHRARDTMQEFVAIMGAAAYFVWMVGIATSAAAGISSEREEDTWISLLGTTLSGKEILLAKAAGAAWRWRFVGGVPVVLWTLGFLAGAIHPIAYIFTLALFVAFSLFALALGSILSLRAKSTTRATVLTIVIMLILNGGYSMCLIPFANSLEPIWLMPCTPFVIGSSPASFGMVESLLGDYPSRIKMHYNANYQFGMMCLISLIFHAITAIFLATLAVQSFDDVADRPRSGGKPVHKEIFEEEETSV